MIDRFLRFVPSLLILLILGNFGALWYISASREPRVVYHVMTNSTVKVATPEKIVSPGDSPTAPVVVGDGFRTNDYDGVVNPRKVVKAPYHYFFGNGVRRVQIYGRFFLRGIAYFLRYYPSYFPGRHYFNKWRRIEKFI